MKFAGFIRSILILVVIFTIAARSQNLIPLAVGNKYYFNMTNYDTAGVVVSTRLDSFVVVGDTVISSEQWFFDGYGYSTNRLDGFYTFNPGSQPYLLFKYPAIVGDHYATPVESVYVTHVDTLITVPSGNYLCYLYEFKRISDGTLKYRYYVAPNLFYVIRERYSKTASGTLYRGYRLELLSYSTVTDVRDHAMTPFTYSLLQNYPNPFNPSTKISYSLPHTGDVTLSIYNLLGQRIETLVDGKQDFGLHEIQWNASSFPSGIYFYQLKSKEYVATKKLLLAK